MNKSAEKLLGFAVWEGGKWYVRHRYLRRLPSVRVAALSGLAALTAGAVGVTLARRALG
jgi:hypothetical protein